MIIIPINENLHWSLAIWVNPESRNSALDNYTKAQRSYIIHLDSIRGNHDKSGIKAKLIDWLTLHASGGGEGASGLNEKVNIVAPMGTFNNEYFNMYCTVHNLILLLLHDLVPSQHNGYDCGVFVCKFAESIFNCLHSGGQCSFVPESKKFYDKHHRSRTFQLTKWITNDDSFQFPTSTIDKLRIEMCERVREEVHLLQQEG